MNQTIGFIGGGNMGSAMIGGMIAADLVKNNQIMTADRNIEQLESLKSIHGILTTTDNLEVVEKSDILFLAVKPNIYPIVISEIKDSLKEDTIVVSIAAGLSISYLMDLFGKEIKLVRAMPNTPALVLEGMSGIVPGALVNEEETELILQLFSSFGKASVVPESLMDTVTGVSGSSPAYAYVFIEAMADAAVADGMPRNQAYLFAAQAVLGAAKMVLETGKHPGELKDMVCSPGGTTIEAVSRLEQNGFRGNVISAQRACVEKSKKMSK